MSMTPITMTLVRDSSAFRRLFFSTCWSRGTSESSIYEKQRICRCNSASTHFHVSWLSDFIFYPKPLYKSLHQSFSIHSAIKIVLCLYFTIPPQLYIKFISFTSPKLNPEPLPITFKKLLYFGTIVSLPLYENA